MCSNMRGFFCSNVVICSNLSKCTLVILATFRPYSVISPEKKKLYMVLGEKGFLVFLNKCPNPGSAESLLKRVFARLA